MPACATIAVLAACRQGNLSGLKDVLTIQNVNDGRLGEYPIHLAAEKGHTELLEYLIKFSANVHLHDDLGKTALVYACEMGHVEAAQVLLNHGSDVNEIDDQKRSPLHEAVRHTVIKSSDRVRLVECLLGHGANINAKDWDKCSALHFACSNSHEEIVKLLMSHGAEVNATDKQRSTPLHKVIECPWTGRPAIVTYLLQHDAEVDAADCRMWTPLHSACEYANHPGSHEIVKELIKRGARVNAIDAAHNTPLHLLARKGEKAVPLSTELMKSGADPYNLNSLNESPVDLGGADFKKAFNEAFPQGYAKRKNDKPFCDMTNTIGQNVPSPFCIISASQVSHEPKKHEAPEISWEAIKRLGQGGYGTVELCKDLATGQQMALKQIKYPEGEHQRFMREVEFTKTLSHPNLVKYIRSEDDSSKRLIRIFMEYMPGGSVSELLRSKGKLTEKVCGKYTRQILEGLAYLHEHRILHRDVKGGNLLLDSTHEHLKLGDLGIAKEMAELAGMVNMTVGVGTPHWMAPEVISTRSYGRKADVWSLGCTVVEMLTTYPPFHLVDKKYVIDRLCKCDYQPEYKLNDCSENVEDFLSHCFQKPRRRYMAVQLLEHPFCHHK